MSAVGQERTQDNFARSSR